MSKFCHLILLALLLVSPVLSALEKQANTRRDTNLYAKPFKDADVVAELASDSTITLLKRKGGWYAARVSDKQGWIRLTDVRLKRRGQAGQESSGVGELLSELATGREKSDEVTTATAVKGLGEEDLRNAEPDLEALASLDSYAADVASAELAASKAGLQARQLRYRDAEGNEITQTPEGSSNKSTSDDEEDTL